MPVAQIPTAEWWALALAVACFVIKLLARRRGRVQDAKADDSRPITMYGDEIDQKCFEHKQKIRAITGWPKPDTRPRVWLPEFEKRSVEPATDEGVHHQKHSA